MKLYRHQIEGLEKTKGSNKVAFYWDMGLGKTFVGAEKMMQFGEKVNLVICQKSKVNDWVDHFKQYYRVKVFDCTRPKQLGEYFGLAMGQRFTVVGVVNYDLVWRRREFGLLKDFTLLLDESSLIQNEATQRTKCILNMNAKNVILLSGTPTGGKYERLWSQMHLLGWNISKDLYWKQYVNVEYLDVVGKSIPIVVGYKNVERLKRKMAQYGCQFLKTDEVFDLPSQTFQKIKVPVSKEYLTFRKDKVVTVTNTDFESKLLKKLYSEEKELIGDTSLTRMLYERQLCGIYSMEKMKAFEDLLDSTEDRLVVFYNFTDELEALKRIAGCHNRPFGVVNGEQKEPEMIEQEGAVLFVQYQAGAMGLNLQSANKMVFFTLPLSSELYEQAKKRIHRIGQDRPCFYYQLICAGSIEEKILKTLELRKDYTEKLFEKDEEE